MIVIHYTAMTTAEEARDRLCDPVAQVSAHYVISSQGRLWQLVEEEQRAWHAGAGQWGTLSDINSHSIGIELANTGAQPFAQPQIKALEHLLGGIMKRWSIPPQGIIGHSDMALGRKIDPGPRFDWRRLALQGLSVWPEPRSGDDFFRDSRVFGYAMPEGGEETLLQAFRDRFRPGATGPLDETDRDLMADLAARWPVG
ncbi:N-acetylmuramoyl-L-alanine amidase [Puniceibacterium sediminis]|uniref:N-acetylmuramoyl-L-alanine amidase n=1 Tax=Puniceibacterium sediminis TaxID=1608407 RepID=UPI000B7839A5|nr:N-acetylmuramoyl-L-alanine amidase [Puniceibacterium sediminis]